MNLFLENKYPVFRGKEDASVGFCTVWNKPETAIAAAPEVLEKAAIVGTLYSRQGVNPLLRNLALNPQIRTLAIWGNGTLSNTPFGLSGSSLLKALWENGVEADSTIKGTKFQLELEIDIEVVEKIRANVELLDLSDFGIVEAVSKLPTEKPEAYMQPVAFDPPAPRKTETMPHEDVGFTFRGSTVIDTWKKVVFHIMRYGIVKGTQYGMGQRELPSVQWVIEGEKDVFPGDVPQDWPNELVETVGATESAIAEYHDVFLSPTTKPGVSYTYGSRLRAWDFEGHQAESIDQIKHCIIGNLGRSPDSRRGVAVTFVPPIDTFAKVDTPCLVSVQALQSDGKVHLFCTFRSHDIFKAAIPNAFGLIRMHDEIAEATQFERGSLSIVSNSAHIYEGDYDHAEKLIDCEFVSREPKKVFDAADTDPRGSFVIRLEGEEIVAEHQSVEGAVLGEYRGQTAKEISRKIAQLHLASRIDHALDIGHELQKAEHALKLGLPYTQDHSLKLGPSLSIEAPADKPLELA